MSTVHAPLVGVRVHSKDLAQSKLISVPVTSAPHDVLGPEAWTTICVSSTRSRAQAEGI
jgi:hypothetical protein